MLCLKTHSAILYKDVTYFRILLYSRMWFVNLIFIGISNYHIAYFEMLTNNNYQLANYIYNYIDFHKCIVKGVEIYFKIRGDHCACVMKMKSWISHDWKPIKINVLHPVKMCSTSTLWWMNRDMIRNINWVGNIKKIGYLISFICNYIDLNVFVSLLITRIRIESCWMKGHIWKTNFTEPDTL